MKRLAAPLILSLFLAACSGLDVKENTDIKDKGDPSGSFLTGKSEQGIVISDLGNAAGESGPAALPINALLWRASLDIASFVPLKDVRLSQNGILLNHAQMNVLSWLFLCLIVNCVLMVCVCWSIFSQRQQMAGLILAEIWRWRAKSKS